MTMKLKKVNWIQFLLLQSITEEEVKYSVGKSNYFISDIFGISMSLNNSNKEPHIAIEIIDSHFPDLKPLIISDK